MSIHSVFTLWTDFLINKQKILMRRKDKEITDINEKISII